MCENQVNEYIYIGHFAWVFNFLFNYLHFKSMLLIHAAC